MSEVLRSNSSSSCFSRPMSCDRSRIAKRLRSPEITYCSPPSASALPASSAALEAGNQAVAETSEQYVISGERNLLAVSDLSQDMGRLKQLFDLFERKTLFLRILDLSLRGQGVQIFIGGESGFSAPDDVSVVTSPYRVDGAVVGTVGVIGPTRMAYDRVIPIVDVTAKLLSSALSQH